MSTTYFQQYFSEPLVDLACEAPRYASVYSPQPEVGLPRFGVSAELLEKSESYFQKYQQYDYIFGLIETANCFSRQTTMALSQYGGFKCPEALPNWAWKIIERYDGFFSEKMKQDLLIEGSIVYTK